MHMNGDINFYGTTTSIKYLNPILKGNKLTFSMGLYFCIITGQISMG